MFDVFKFKHFFWFYQPKPVQATQAKQTAAAPVAPAPISGASDLNEQIAKQGDLVRQLKSAKAEKAKINEAVKSLLELKAKYKAATGQVSFTSAHYLHYHRS